MSSVPLPPESAGGHLRHVMTSAAAALGVEPFTDRLGLPPASIAVVVLADGLGDQLLAAHSGHARFLASAWRNPRAAQVLDTGAPTTTAASLASLGTGLATGQHGLVGYDVFAPELGRVVNMLGQWDHDLDPLQWQPHPTVFERAAASGVRVVTSSRPQFRDSALTHAALRGGDFAGAQALEQRFALAADWIRSHRPGPGRLQRGRADPLLVYLYVDELDKTGHRTGAGSDAWLTALEALDAAASRFCQRLAHDFGQQVTVLLTADHGMVNIAEEFRIDFSARTDLLAGVAHTGGEPRFLHLYAAQGAHPEGIADRWRDAYGEQAWVLTRQEAIAKGWFGTVEEQVGDRIGDVLVAAHAPLALFHTTRTGPGPLKMVGQHGSLTEAERRVPLLELTGRGFVS
ncbi:alkaline phosphatase family protein [Nesterenkonia sphaerica]|uniref:Alkaline phosphatase family protein n=1 Tax=Nesterenkonia sphaerica TaxID=1804988 RepID=A0A5R9AN96_9MICC|nr:nucleotide pyrophosphatase/phosphodiesterase family protein [Nesterenkonia sphaerica]TLP79485.1 alkaline phosphatase family protein [Nesterenkonia sphaerica]